MQTRCWGLALHECLLHFIVNFNHPTTADAPVELNIPTGYGAGYEPTIDIMQNAFGSEECQHTYNYRFGLWKEFDLS